MDYKVLNFVIFCVGSVADALKMSAKDVYHRMSKGGIISDYIVPCYDVLHTFSREYIVEDLVDLMNKKGVLEAAGESSTHPISLFLSQTCIIRVTIWTLATVCILLRYLKFVESITL